MIEFGDPRFSGLLLMPPVFLSNPVDAIMLAAATLLWFVPEVILAHVRRAAPGARVRDRGSGILVMVGIWLGVASAWLAAYTAPQLAMGGDRTFLFAAGILCMLAGIAFRWYAIHVLAEYFSVVVAVQPGHEIIERGPYRLLRHPSYSGALLTILGYGLAFTNWLSLVLAVVIPLFAYSYRIRVEERALLDALGDDYRAYMKRTKRIIPFVI